MAIATVLLLAIAVVAVAQVYVQPPQGRNHTNLSQHPNSSLCPFGGAALQKDSTNLSLCPFAARGKRRPSKRTLLKKLEARPFCQHSRHSSAKSFWELYKTIANEHLGLFGDSMASEEILANAPLVRGMVALSEHESAERYAKCKADEYREWMTEVLSGIRLSDLMLELESLNRAELKLVHGACVYLRHSWHQGNPSLEPLETTHVTDSCGKVLKEPAQLTAAVEFVANRLGVAPFFNVYSWLFCNWRWTPADGKRNHDEGLTFETICDLKAGSMSPRFYWLTGAARASEANFWRAFAYSELMAIPLYGEVGQLLDEVTSFSNDDSRQSPTTQSIEHVLRCLQRIGEVTRNITAALVAYGNSELIDARHFLQMQGTAHYAGTTAGASGFQAPCMVLLDTLLGVDYSALSDALQQTRDENIDEMQPEVVSLIFDFARPGSKNLRTFIDSIACPRQRLAVQTAFNGVADELVMWRSSHRSRAGNYIKASTVTTGRTNDDMDGNVHSTFLGEMSSIIAATQATKIK